MSLLAIIIASLALALQIFKSIHERVRDKRKVKVVYCEDSGLFVVTNFTRRSIYIAGVGFINEYGREIYSPLDQDMEDGGIKLESENSTTFLGFNFLFNHIRGKVKGVCVHDTIGNRYMGSLV